MVSEPVRKDGARGRPFELRRLESDDQTVMPNALHQALDHVDRCGAEQRNTCNHFLVFARPGKFENCRFVELVLLLEA